MMPTSGTTTALPPPPAAETRLSNRRDRRRARIALLGAVVVGVGVDLALRAPVVGLAATTTVVAVALVVFVCGSVGNRQAVAVLATAVAFAVLFSLRVSPWLVPLNMVAVAGLLVLGATMARRGSLVDLTATSLLDRGGRAVVAMGRAPVLFVDRLTAAVPVPTASSGQLVGGIVRGLGLAVPVVLVVGLLLASADAVFASFFSVPVDPAAWFVHGLLIGLGVWLACGALVLAFDRRPERTTFVGAPLGSTEVTVVLGGLVLVYGLFVVAQIVASSAGESYLLETTGLTRAEYARSGFFQLLWAAGITLVVLLGLHALADPDRRGRRRLAVLNALAVGLTLAVVVVAIRRLGLYDEAFGLTMLRLYSTVFAWWLGAVFLVVGMYLVVRPSRPWLTVAVGASALAALFVVNLTNPERIVVEHNVDRAAAGEEIDVAYLAGLSDDALPTLVASLDRLPVDEGRRARVAICTAADEGSIPWYAHNRSVAQARDARATLCAD
jgi:hypothetical protein